jgi:hypothetical protein
MSNANKQVRVITENAYYRNAGDSLWHALSAARLGTDLYGMYVIPMNELIKRYTNFKESFNDMDSDKRFDVIHIIFEAIRHKLIMHLDGSMHYREVKYELLKYEDERRHPANLHIPRQHNNWDFRIRSRNRSPSPTRGKTMNGKDRNKYGGTRRRRTKRSKRSKRTTRRR